MIDIIKNKFDKSIQIGKKYLEILDSVSSGNIDKDMLGEKAEEISKLRDEEKKDYDGLNQVQVSYYLDIINDCQLSFDTLDDFSISIGRICKKLNMQMLRLNKKEISFEYSMLLIGDIKIKTVSEINILLNKMLHEENTYMEEETIKELIICNLRFLITVALLNDYMEEYLIINDFDYFDIIKDDTINIAFNTTMRDADKDLLDHIIEDYIDFIKKRIMVDDNSDLYILLNSKMVVQLLIPYMDQEHLVKYKKEIEGIRVTNANSQAIYALSDTIKKRIKKIQDTN